jgi:hypothetical protein
MNIPARAALVGAAAIAVALGALAIVPRPSGPGAHPPGPSPTSPSAPVASASSRTPAASAVACEDGLDGCIGLLGAGRHVSGNFQPKLYYAGAEGWTNSIDVETVFKLDPPGAGDPYILAWSSVHIAKQTATCELARDPDRGDASADWISFVQGHPGLVASSPVTLAHTAGWTATAIDLAVAPSWKATCPSHGDEPYVMLLTSFVLGAEYGLPADQRLHLVAFDAQAPCGLDDTCPPATVIALTYGSQQADRFAVDTAQARAIIETFELGCGPSVNRGPCGGPAQ